MERIGILGGTFNPIHNGHLHIARAFLEKLSLDRVLLVPTRMPPHKDGGELVSGGQRLEMCRIAAQCDERLGVSDIELKREGLSYTVDTLRELHQQHPDTRFYFIMGADMFLTFEKWKNFDVISSLAAICTASRHDGEIEKLRSYAEKLSQQYHTECHVESFPVVEISSTEIRQTIADGGDAGALVPPGVNEYIQKNGLYCVNKIENK